MGSKSKILLLNMYLIFLIENKCGNFNFKLNTIIQF